MIRIQMKLLENSGEHVFVSENCKTKFDAESLRGLFKKNMLDSVRSFGISFENTAYQAFFIYDR